MAEVDSSTIAAFCCVTLSSSPTAELISTSVVACSCAETAIPPTRSAISATLPTIPSSAAPVLPTSATPCSTWRVEAEIRVLICLAASAERPASARTSLATTAKPRPASPERAASTAAFKASRLVWKAISSMTVTIWLISRADFSMSLIARTASCISAPERSASERAVSTTVFACPAASADLLTRSVTCSTDAVVSSIVAACCSVRPDRSLDAARISPVSSWMEPGVRDHRRDRLLQLVDRVVEVAAQFLVLGREGLVQAHREVAVGERAERRRPASSRPRTAASTPPAVRPRCARAPRVRCAGTARSRPAGAPSRARRRGRSAATERSRRARPCVPGGRGRSSCRRGRASRSRRRSPPRRRARSAPRRRRSRRRPAA